MKKIKNNINYSEWQRVDDHIHENWFRNKFIKLFRMTNPYYYLCMCVLGSIL